MFCSNCGAELAEGAKFCSECGTKVGETQAKIFETHAFDEPAGMQEKVEEKAMSMDEAFKEKVSFDWSNVIDEPKRKEVPQSVKSPWSATTGNLDKRDLYAEMTQSDDLDRTQNYIDLRKADKEERERAALDKSIEYTEVLEIDPELLGGVKPPKLHYAPLYDDVDEPVKTPFDLDDTIDAYATGQLDRLHIEEEAKIKEEVPVTAAPASGPASPKFELPDFLKKAKDFVGGTDSKDNYEKIEKPEGFEPIVEETEPTIEETVTEAKPVIEETVSETEPIIEEPVIEEPVIEESFTEHVEEKTSDAFSLADLEETSDAFSLADLEETVDDVEEVVEEKTEETVAESTDEAADAVSDDTENLYLDLDMLSSEIGTERVSRATAHALAGDYDDDEDDDIEEKEEREEAIDENQLFTEMNETPGPKTGMTIAAPADEEAEIEALKRRLAELTGTVEMNSALLNDDEKEPEAEVKEDEPELDDFTFEPEVTSAEDKLFAGLSAASEIKLQDAVAVDEPTADEAIDFAAPKLDDFVFEPEITAEDDKFFAELTPASEVAAPEVVAPVAEEPVFDIPVAETPVVETPIIKAPVLETPVVDTPPTEVPAVEAPVVETPVVEKLEFAPPVTTGLSADQQNAFDSLVFDLPKEEAAATPVITEPEVPAVTEEPEIPVIPAEPETPIVTSDPETPVVTAEPEIHAMGLEPAAPAISAESELHALGLEPVAPAAPAVSAAPEVHAMGLEPAAPAVSAEPETPVLDFASLMAEKQSTEPPKPTDALSLDDLEKDLFGSTDSAEETEAETTKKIDKFYTLYRKNEEFQRLLDEEYSRLKGEHIEISQEEVDKELGITGAGALGAAVAAGTAGAAIAAAADKPVVEAAPVATPPASQDVAAALEELSTDSRPVEDATIYQMDMPEELKELALKAEPKTGLAADAAVEAAPVAVPVPEEKPEKKSKGLFGKSKDKKDKKDKKKKKEENAAGFGLNGEEVGGAAAASTPATAGAAVANAETGAEQAQVKVPATTQPEVIYQDVDSGSTILTILAVLVAILLVFLLAIILIMHLAPDSNIALTVDQVIENITRRFSALDTMNGVKWL